jgi:nitroreductase
MATKPSLDVRLDAGRDYAYFDLGMAALALMLQATREGLYAHPIAGYTPSKVAKAAGLPEDFVPLNLIIIGKPGDDALLNEGQRLREHGPRQRKGLEEVVFIDSWERPWGMREISPADKTYLNGGGESTTGKSYREVG